MGSAIFVTCGVSLYNHCKRNEEIGIGNPTKAAEKLREIGASAPMDIKLGAEICSNTSLLNLQHNGEPRFATPYVLHLLVSDTDEGAWVGSTLKAYYSKMDNIEAVHIHSIEGLNSSDGTRSFVNKGLKNLVRCMGEQLRKITDRNSIAINATGGYKAQISFAGLIGQILHIPVFYMFENFSEIIEMPGLPIDFDKTIWLSNYDLFCRLAKEDLTADEFPFSELEGSILSILDVEEIDGKQLYALSPMLQLMHQGFLQDWPDASREPKKAAVPATDKIRLNKNEVGHRPKGAEKFVRLLAEISWVTRINDIKFESTSRSHLKTRMDRSKPDEAEVCWSDGDKGVVLMVTTTAESAAEMNYVRHYLVNFIQENS